MNTIYQAHMLMAHTTILFILWSVVGFETMATWYGIYHLLRHMWNTIHMFRSIDD